MVRKCSHCGNIGHNSRTCNKKKNGCCKVGNGNNNTTSTSCGVGIRLFGVHLDTISSSPPIKKSFSFDCLSSSAPPPSSSSPSSSLSSGSHVQIPDHKTPSSNGYSSDEPFRRGVAPDKRKGVPWTEEEHRTFLIGLEKLGKGDWRGISRKYVTTRTPTQVASHAQKYFLRQNNTCSNDKKKRRSSLFDMDFDKASNRQCEIDLNSEAKIGDLMMMMKKSPETKLELSLGLSASRPLIAQNESSSSTSVAISVT